MTYRVYSGPPSTEIVPPLEKERWLYKEFGLLDEALGWARHVNDGGRVALLIEGDDGTQMSKREIFSGASPPREPERALKTNARHSEAGSSRLGQSRLAHLPFMALAATGQRART